MADVEQVVLSRTKRLVINSRLTRALIVGLYTDESPGLKVDPVVVLVLSLVFIFSVVALHSKSPPPLRIPRRVLPF